jgi:tRNA threonylcarbamoyladenosine biosynthesis protein TsaE
MLDFISHSVAQTVRIGQRLGSHMQPGDLLLLHGDLGTGKTQLVRGVAQAFESPDLVTSPSFVLINDYQAGPRWPGMHLYHVDLYRIDDPADLASIGLEELWNPHDICLIEWAEHAGAWLPAEYLAIQLGHLDETKRVLRFVPQGERYIDLLERFKATAFA